MKKEQVLVFLTLSLLFESIFCAGMASESVLDKRIAAIAAEITPQLVEIRRDLHASSRTFPSGKKNSRFSCRLS
ncbi:MAG: hypothetical protein ACUVWQ_08800 [Candidatus Aminicenantales bacterium]